MASASEIAGRYEGGGGETRNVPPLRTSGVLYRSPAGTPGVAERGAADERAAAAASVVTIDSEPQAPTPNDDSASTLAAM